MFSLNWTAISIPLLINNYNGFHAGVHKRNNVGLPSYFTRKYFKTPDKTGTFPHGDTPREAKISFI